MVEEGWLSAADRAKITGPAKTIATAKTKSLSGTNGYVIAAVTRGAADHAALDRLRDRPRRPADHHDDQQDAQDAAVAAMTEHARQSTKDVYAGLAAVRPGDGSIVAMYGGADYSKRQFSSATDATMQAGSTFKPFALIAALQQGRPDHGRRSTATARSSSAPTRSRTRATRASGGSTCCGPPPSRSTRCSPTSTSRSAPRRPKAAAIAAGMPAEHRRPGRQPGQRAGHVVTARRRRGQRLRNHRSEWSAGHAHLVAKVSSESRGIDYTAPNQVTAGLQRRRGRRHDRRAPAGHQERRAPVPAQPSWTAPSPARRARPRSTSRVWFTGFIPQLAVSVGMFRDVNGTPAPAAEHLRHQRAVRQHDPAVDLARLHGAGHAGQPVQDFPKRSAIGDDQVARPSRRRPRRAPTTTAPTTTTDAPPPATTSTPPPPRRRRPPPATTTTAPPATRTARPTRTTQPPAAEQPAGPSTPAPVG